MLFLLWLHLFILSGVISPLFSSGSDQDHPQEKEIQKGKMEVVKQEMARVNVIIFGISKIKWNGMAEFNSDDHYIYYCGQESLRRNGVAIVVNKRF